MSYLIQVVNFVIWSVPWQLTFSSILLSIFFINNNLWTENLGLRGVNCWFMTSSRLIIDTIPARNCICHVHAIAISTSINHGICSNLIIRILTFEMSHLMQVVDFVTWSVPWQWWASTLSTHWKCGFDHFNPTSTSTCFNICIVTSSIFRLR